LLSENAELGAGDNNVGVDIANGVGVSSSGVGVINGRDDGVGSDAGVRAGAGDLERV
jgi:hypothetical protein